MQHITSRMALFLAAAVVASCSGPPAPEAPAQAPFTTAVVRSDGLLVPFATYADGVWSGPPIQEASVSGDRPTVVERAEPWFADRLDTLGQWHVRYAVPLELPRFDTQPDEATLLVSPTPVATNSHCTSVWALEQTEGREVAQPGLVHRVDAIAFSTPVATTPVAELSVDPALDTGALAVVRARFDEAEAAEAARRRQVGRYLPRPFGEDAGTTPLAFTRLSRVGRDADYDVYLFEAKRTYASAAVPTLAGCELATIMTGWLVESPWGGYTILSHDLVMTDCDRKGSPILRPLVTTRLDGRLYTVVVARHYEGESYHVYEVEQNAVREVLDVDGGGC